MNHQSLTGFWQFRQLTTSDWLPAAVPGCVHTDLMAHNRIPDPFFGANELDVQWVAESDWEYKRIFTLDPTVSAHNQIILKADGLDTLCEVRLNGEVLAHTNNQHRSWEWEVKNHLQDGDNTIHLIFTGPAKYTAEAQAERRLVGVPTAIDGAPHLRKAASQFGWDWGPMLPSVGIWKDIRLEGHTTARLADIHLRQIHTEDAVTISAGVLVEAWHAAAIEAILTVTSPDGEIVHQSASYVPTDPLSVQIEDPQLWWPSGLGDQPLYQVTVSLHHQDECIDERNYNLGLRTIELRREPDEFGESFQFVVNGVPIFAKGGNWIPADSFLNRFSDDRLEKLIADSALAHHNMIRVWGGGIYETEFFYDLCDRYGLLVWQDFAFACSIYPLDQPVFIENLAVEVAQNVQRIRHRTCLALWCGNNEMEEGWESWGWAPSPLLEALPPEVKDHPILKYMLDLLPGGEPLPDYKVLKEAYDQFFHRTLPDWLAPLDPDTPYWPSSPSSGTPFQNTNSQAQGDAHYWDVWHGRKPFTAFRGTFPRFMSEFGFQAFPTLETVHQYTVPEDRNLTSFVMEHHQRGNHGNGLIISQMTETFRMPASFESWIYLSLILQAEGIRFGVEHWRRNMHRVSGTLYWQLNDCWPVASWASIDYYGRWKALHYASKRFFEPLLLSVEDAPPHMTVHLTNDRTEPFEGRLEWRVETSAGQLFASGGQAVTAPALADTKLIALNFMDQVTPANERDLVLVCELYDPKDELLTQSVYPFVPSKHLALTDPSLSTDLAINDGKLSITLTGKTLARFVELKLEGTPNTVFSDNYFDLPANVSRTITCALPLNWTLERAKEALRAYTLYDSYQ